MRKGLATDAEDAPAEGLADVLAPVETSPTLSDRVYVALKRSIADQRLKPGRRLSVPQLARQLQVSRTPVRDALERLAKDGLVVTSPNRGAFVTVLHRVDINEIYQLREMLEGLAARLAATRVDSALLSQLSALVLSHEDAAADGDLSSAVRVDLEFHRLIRERAGNRRLARSLENLQDQIRIVFQTSATIPGRMQRAVQEHREIVDALRRGDPGLAEAAARHHILRIREAVMAHMHDQDDRHR